MWSCLFVVVLVTASLNILFPLRPPGRRAAIALVVLFVYVNVTWMWGWSILWDDEVDADTGIRFDRLDWKDTAARGPVENPP